MPQSVFSDDELKSVFGTGVTKASPAKPKFTGQTFTDDELNAHFNPPKGVTDTLKASREEASRMAFEKALPITDRTKQYGSYTPEEEAQPDPYHMSPAQSAMLREYLLRGVEELGIDPGHPIKSGADVAWRATQAAIRMVPSAVEHPIATGEKIIKTALGAAAAGPVQMFEAQTPGELARGAAQTTEFTYAPLRSALSPFVDGTPEELMARSAALKTWEPLKGKLGDKVNSVVDAVKAPGSSVMERVAKLKAGKPSLVPPPMFPEKVGFEGVETPGYETPGNVVRENPNDIAADELKRSKQWNTDETPAATSSTTRIPRPDNPVLTRDLDALRHQKTIDNAPEMGDFRKPTNGQPIDSTKLNQSLRPGFEATPASSDLNFFRETQEGVPAETIQFLGKGKLNSIARDAQTIQAEHGYNVLNKIDEAVGGKAMRQKLLSTPEGQNVLANYVTALRQQNASYMMQWGNKLQDLVTRTGKRTVLPPPPG